MIDNGIDPGVDGKLHRRVCAWWMQGLVTGSIHGARCMIQATLRQAAEVWAFVAATYANDHSSKRGCRRQ